MKRSQVFHVLLTQGILKAIKKKLTTYMQVNLSDYIHKVYYTCKSGRQPMDSVWSGETPLK